MRRSGVSRQCNADEYEGGDEDREGDEDNENEGGV